MTCFRLAVITLLCSIPLAGCTSPGRQLLPYGVSRIAGGESQPVFDAARQVLEDSGYAIEHTDAATGTIITRGVTASRRSLSSRQVVRISPQAELRRVIQLRIAKTGDAVNVYCQVAIQELDTESYRIMQQQMGSNDRAGETAIDRGAGTTLEQNSVWRTVERDKAQERQILESVLQRAGVASPNT